MRAVRGAGAAAVLLLLAAAPVAAAPAAIVEDVVGSVAGIDVLDYVDAGKVIELKGNGSLVLGYLKSCIRETIRGGTVKVGTEQSEVTGGKVERKTSPCDGGKLQLTAEQAGKSGAMVFRKKPAASKPAEAPEAPHVTIYSLSPAVAAKAPGELTIERLDQTGTIVTVRMTAARMDLAKAGVKLDAGGTYRAKLGTQRLVFAVDGKATASAGPLAGRLIQF